LIKSYEKLFTTHLLSLVFGLFLLLPAPAFSLYTNYYVKASATGAGDGSSWTNAFTNLQAALDAASVGDTICVAAGTYFPTHRHAGDSLRHLHFTSAKTLRCMVDFLANPVRKDHQLAVILNYLVTTLSGDLGIQGDTIDNAFHVVFIDYVSTRCGWMDFI
jgi:hypothetical protein